MACQISCMLLNSLLIWSAPGGILGGNALQKVAYETPLAVSASQNRALHLAAMTVAFSMLILSPNYPSVGMVLAQNSTSEPL